VTTHPKYLNSPETPVFHKGRETLWPVRGAQTRAQARTAAGGGRLYGCGGAGPVRYRQCGRHARQPPPRANTSNSSIAPCPKWVFCFDGDRAGRAAAWRALENALAILKMAARHASCFCLTGKIRIRWYAKRVRRPSTTIGESIPLSEYLFEALSAQVDTSSMDGRARLVELAKPMLEQLPTGVFQRMLVDRLEELARLPRNALLDCTASRYSQPLPRQRPQPNVAASARSVDS